MLKHSHKTLKGFTLIEILVVVALIAILATITFIAINPAQNFADARNAERSSHVNQILNAITQYTSQQGNALGDFGTIPACSGTPAAIGTGAGNINVGALVSPAIIVGIPVEPQGGTAADTGYTICLASAGRVQVAAPDAENGATISVQR